MEDDAESYILLLLADSNLPTGSFVASSGLESYVKHGFPAAQSSQVQATVDFLRDSLASYARTAIPFVSDAHRAAHEYAAEKKGVDETVQTLAGLDELYQAMTLNHVSRRASMAQGVALLTLYSKGFSRPKILSAFAAAESEKRDGRMATLLDQLKLKVRREELSGHLPICWGALTAALGLTLERAQYLHLFLHARGLLSAAVRLNDLGPYGAQQILLHAVRPLVAVEAARCSHLRTGVPTGSEVGFDETTDGPANTWPLGEILAGRHDLQHSRIFNS